MISNLLLPSGVTAVALILLVLVSIIMRKMTRVPIACIFQLKPGQEPGRTNISVPSSTVMKPKLQLLAFIHPFMYYFISSACGVVELSLCLSAGLALSLTSLPPLLGLGVWQ